MLAKQGARMAGAALLTVVAGLCVWAVHAEQPSRHAQQRSQQPDVALLDDGCHAGETVAAAASCGSHRHGLRLVVGVVGQQQVKDAAAAAGRQQQVIARRPRGLL